MPSTTRQSARPRAPRPLSKLPAAASRPSGGLRETVATSSTNAAAALGDITRFAEMRKRLWFLLGALVVYRVGTFIPVPGIDAARLAAFFSNQHANMLGMFNMFSGGA